MDKPTRRPEALVLDLGCRLNQADGTAISAELQEAGFKVRQATHSSKLDLIIVNSCAVTAPASTKSFAAIRKLKRDNPAAFIILTGCAASVKSSPPPEGLPFDLLLPNDQKNSTARTAAERFGLKVPSQAKTPPNPTENAKTRAYLKIQDGCDKFCAFCVVPLARGRERSPDVELIYKDTVRLINSNYKEIVLTGVNTCAYRSGKDRLPELLERLLSIPGDFRLRLGSTEPDPLLFKVIDIMASNPKLCRFLHMPLQHGSDKILKAMGRQGTTRQYAELAAYAKEKVPGIHIGADIIAGLPGETDSIFEDSYKFIESLSLANMHVFSYSPREGTKAASMPGQATRESAKRRHELLRTLAMEKSRAFSKSQCGRTLRILTERSNSPGIANGWSDNYLKVHFPVANPSRNEFHTIKVELIDINSVLYGTLLSIR